MLRPRAAAGFGGTEMGEAARGMEQEEREKGKKKKPGE